MAVGIVVVQWLEALEYMVEVPVGTGEFVEVEEAGMVWVAEHFVEFAPELAVDMQVEQPEELAEVELPPAADSRP